MACSPYYVISQSSSVQKQNKNRYSSYVISVVIKYCMHMTCEQWLTILLDMNYYCCTSKRNKSGMEFFNFLCFSELLLTAKKVAIWRDAVALKNVCISWVGLFYDLEFFCVYMKFILLVPFKLFMWNDHCEREQWQNK